MSHDTKMASASCFGYLCIVFVLVCMGFYAYAKNEKSFGIDYKHNTFVRDGKPFRYISGSIHLFRVPYQYWDDRLRKMAAAGLNAIETYIAWNTHEPSPGVYNFTGQQDLPKFFQIAQSYNLSVILRSGPYTCGEWEFGGLPAWLLNTPGLQVRTADPTFLKPVDSWLTKMYSVIKPHLHKNGGNIITVQIENEYGSYFACDYDYLRYLRKKAIDELGDDVVLFTTDGDGPGFLRCGTLEGLYTTVDFGVTFQPEKNFAVQRAWEPEGPLVNSEFYTGWLDHWGYKHSLVNATNIAKSLDMMLALGANINMYMFEGGTNFGYWNGANYPTYQPVPTSYDYDSPLSEAGDITDKYWTLREVISKYNPPTVPVPPSTPKYSYGDIKMKFLNTLFDYVTITTKPVDSVYPLTMEQIEHYYGFILYTHELGRDVKNENLTVSGIRDRGYISITSPQLYEIPAGIVDRTGNTSVNITAAKGDFLCILVENMGRINYGSQLNLNHKGLVDNVTISNITLTKWQQYPVMTSNDDLTSKKLRKIKHRLSNNTGETIVPSVYEGILVIEDDPMDTYLDMSLWTKGQLLINGHNLGRYWPKRGPQVRLYVPKFFLQKGINEIMLLELENSPCNIPNNCKISFIDKPLLNGNVTSNIGEDFYPPTYGSRLYH